MTPPKTAAKNWDGKPYYSLDSYLKEQFGEKVYRLSLDAGLTCPNRDGALGFGGCIFCSQGGSGDFAVPISPARRPDDTHSLTTLAKQPDDTHSLTTLARQLDAAKKRISQKSGCKKFIAYFQSYTNTYGPLPYLSRIFQEVLDQPDMVALSVATRPDCLPPEVLALLSRLNRKKPVWVELGLQTIHPSTREFIRSRYSLSCFEKAVFQLKSLGISTIVHVILCLPGETREMMLETIDYLAALPIDGIKLQLLHILTDTDLYRYYQQRPFPLPKQTEYCHLICDCIEHLPPNIVIHRLTGDGPKKLLAAPLWSANKKQVLNAIHKTLKERGSFQGKALLPAKTKGGQLWQKP